MQSRATCATKTNNYTNNDLVHRFNKQNLITLITNSKHSSLIFPFPFQLFSIDLNHLFSLPFCPLNQFINITLKQTPLAISWHMGWPERERQGRTYTRAEGGSPHPPTLKKKMVYKKLRFALKYIYIYICLSSSKIFRYWPTRKEINK